MTRCDSTQKFKNKICYILNQSNLYWWFAINLLRFTRQRHGGNVGGNHAPITIAVNHILLLEFLQHGGHDVSANQELPQKVRFLILTLRLELHRVQF